MKTVKNIMHRFFGLLPHVNIALSICFIVFFVVDRLNRAMAFINNDITKGMLLVYAFTVMLSAGYAIVNKDGGVERDESLAIRVFESVAAVVWLAATVAVILSLAYGLL